MVTTLLTLAGVGFGAVGGFVTACRHIPNMIARMSPDQVDDLAVRVERLRDGSTR